MQNYNVKVVGTGTANMASVFAALKRVGASYQLVESPEEILSASHVFVPGVGTFGAAMETLRARGFDQALVERANVGLPTIGICVGMQLFCMSSEETSGVRGLGVVSSVLKKFPNSVRVPQLGWNRVIAPKDSQFVTSGHAYFANSYRLTYAPDDWRVCLSDYAGGFIAALERDGVLLCQFHPELSGPWGESILKRWLTAPGSVVTGGRS